MKLPRDLSGSKLARKLARYGYQVDHQTGSHMRLCSNFTGKQHSLTIPNHIDLKIGTLSSILDDVAKYLGKSKQQLMKELFG